jgi:hypothetical protein
VDYTLVDTLSTRIPNPGLQVRGGPQGISGTAAWEALLAAGLGERRFGEVVTEGRSSWVRRAAGPSGEIYIKTYEYKTWVDRLRPTWRCTGPWRRSRAAAEYDALAWMLAHQIPTAAPLAVWEQRRLGWVERAILVTATWPGKPLAWWLDSLPIDAGIPLVTAVGAAIARLHRLGFRDRNLDARNLLVARNQAGGWDVVKIDSPRHFLCRPGNQFDRATEADWARLLPQIQAPELREAALLAAAMPDRQRQRLLAVAAAQSPQPPRGKT